MSDIPGVLANSERQVSASACSMLPWVCRFCQCVKPSGGARRGGARSKWSTVPSVLTISEETGKRKTRGGRSPQDGPKQTQRQRGKLQVVRLQVDICRLGRTPEPFGHFCKREDLARTPSHCYRLLYANLELLDLSILAILLCVFATFERPALLTLR